MTGQPPNESPFGIDNIPALIESAFASARAKGKAEWRRMTTAVLKNRLLQLTGRQFDPDALGFSSFDALLTAFSEIVSLDHTTHPTTVEYLGAASLTRAGKVPPQGMRIRQDLWNAMLDYSAGHEWVWDMTEMQARPIEEAEHEPLIIPTIRREEMADLRAAFAASSEGSLDEDERSRLQRWQMHGLGTSALPHALQGNWNGYVKSEVARRLTNWFKEHEIAVPSNLLDPYPASAAQPADDELARLRTLVVECVKSMTLSELAALDLPAGAMLRAQTHRSSRRHGT